MNKQRFHKVKVIQAHKSNYHDPISFKVGDTLAIEKKKSEYKNWVFVTLHDGNKGWAPIQFIDIVDKAFGVANQEYTARELDTKVGENYQVHKELNEWYWVEDCLDKSRTGWIPVESVIESKELDKTQFPELTVGAIILNPENKVLICKSTKWNNKYVIPGGHVELGEKMEDAVIREVKEETGLDIYDIKLISVQESIFSPTFNGKHHFLFVDYLCRTDSSEVVLNDEAEEYAWVELSEVLNYDLGGFVRNFFEEYFKNRSQYKSEIFYNYVKLNN